LRSKVLANKFYSSTSTRAVPLTRHIKSQEIVS
jgi:hypothetical protein